MSKTLQDFTNPLGKVISNPKNAEIIAKTLVKVGGTIDDVYQVVGDVLKGVKLSEILASIKKGAIGWKHPTFDVITRSIKERDDFIRTPFEVAEGVLICSRCGSNKTYFYQKQVRSIDEPMSTFAQCIKCKLLWVYSG